LMRVSNPNDAPPGVGTSYVAHLIALKWCYIHNNNLELKE